MDDSPARLSQLNKSLSISDLRHRKFRVEELYHSEPSGRTLVRHISWERPISEFRAAGAELPLTPFLKADSSGAPSYTFSQIVRTAGDALRTVRSASTTEFLTMSAHGEPVDGAPSVFDSDSFHAFGFSKKLPDDVEYRPKARAANVSYERTDANSMRDVHEIEPNPTRPSKKVPKLDRSEASPGPRRPRRPTPAGSSARAESGRSAWTAIAFVTLPLFVVVMGLVVSDDDRAAYRCACDFPSDAIVRDLRSNLFGQDRAIAAIAAALDSPSRRNLLVFVGGTGVGKTYASSILMRNVDVANVRLVVYRSTDGDRLDVVRNLSPCGRNLVVVDALKPPDARDVVRFVDALFATDADVTLVLIFNAQRRSNELRPDVDVRESVETIGEAFANVAVAPTTVVFEQLGHETLLRCVRRALAERGVEADDSAVEAVVENVDVAASGCKRVDGKAALLTERSGV